MNKLISILIKDHETYYKRLIDAEVLISALQTLDPYLLLEKKVSHIGAEYSVTVADRLKELDTEYQILYARVSALRARLTETVEGNRVLEAWENGTEEDNKTN